MPLIAVCPRSGTNFLWYLLGTYNAALGSDFSEITGTVVEQITSSKYPLIGPEPVAVGHAYCPRFAETYDGPLKARLEALPYDNAWNALSRWLGRHPGLISPDTNPGTRIAFVFRNPLDQIISLHAHEKDHVEGRPLSERPLEDAFAERLDTYIRFYLTYKLMRERHPDCIRFFHYENLVANPAAVVPEILAYIGHSVDSPDRKAALNKALTLTTPRELRALEVRMGRSLADDQNNKSSSHMRGGEIGKWRGIVSDALYAAAEKRLFEFGVSLTGEFVLGRSEARPTGCAVASI